MTLPALLAIAGLPVIVVILLWIPAYVSFVVAVTAAVRWSIWLEHNPDPESIGSVETPTGSIMPPVRQVIGL